MSHIRWYTVYIFIWYMILSWHACRGQHICRPEHLEHQIFKLLAGSLEVENIYSASTLGEPKYFKAVAGSLKA